MSPYRSLEFSFETLDQEYYQNAGVVNYPNDYDFTRITEFKHFYGQKQPKTTICYEFPQERGDPYYPIPSPECQELYHKYKQMADNLKSVYFVGRLAEYRYINMDEVVASSLSLFQALAGKDSR